MAVNVDQFQQLLDAARPPPTSGFKVPSYCSGDAAEWFTWRKSFETMARVSQWGNARARSEASMRMQGIAGLYTRQVPVGDVPPQGQQAGDYRELLNAYEAIFAPPEDSSDARTLLSSARQKEDETVQGWHARHLALACRAYPARLTDPNEGSNIDGFISGLSDPAVREHCFTAKPDTYQGALDLASARAAARVRVHVGADGKVATLGEAADRASVDAIGRTQATCHVCKKPGHYKRDCEWVRRVREADRRPGSGRGGHRGGRGGPRGRGRGRGRGHYSGSDRDYYKDSRDYYKDNRGHAGRDGQRNRGRDQDRDRRGVNAIDRPDDREQPDFSETYSEN